MTGLGKAYVPQASVEDKANYGVYIYICERHELYNNIDKAHPSSMTHACKAPLCFDVSLQAVEVRAEHKSRESNPSRLPGGTDGNETISFQRAPQQRGNERVFSCLLGLRRKGKGGSLDYTTCSRGRMAISVCPGSPVEMGPNPTVQWDLEMWFC